MAWWALALLMLAQPASPRVRATRPVKLFDDPAASGKVLATLAPDQLCDQLGEKDYKVNLKCQVGDQTLTGWVKHYDDGNETIGHDTLCVQATRLKLRAEPKPTAEVVNEEWIRTRCAPLTAVSSEGWIRIDCRGGEIGWTKAELLAETMPTFEGNLERARDPKLSAADRLSSALRAKTIESSDAMIAMVQQLLAESELAALKPVAKPEQLPVACGDAASLKAAVEQKVKGSADLINTTAPWVFVTSFTGCDRYHVVVVSEARPAATGCASDVLRMTEISRDLFSDVTHYSMGDPFSCTDLAAQRKLQAAQRKDLGEARKALKGLPRSWVNVTKKDGKLVRPLMCKRDVSFNIRDDGETLVLNFDYVQDSANVPIRRVRREGAVFTFEGDDGKVATVTWPAGPDDPDVAKFTGPNVSPFFDGSGVLPADKKGRAAVSNECFR